MVAIRRSISVALTLLGLTLFGCSGRNADWYGTWEGTVDLTHPSIEDDAISNTVNKVTLRIDPDGKFTFVQAGMPHTGKHILKGDTATFKIDRVADRTIDQIGDGAKKMDWNLTAEMRDDGSVLLTVPDAFYEEPIKLTKPTQP